jgi:hypothetical protein
LIIGYGPKDNYGTRTGEHARIDSSGRLGLGTSAPSVKLEVKSPSSATNVLQVTPTTGSGYFRVRETGGNDIDVRLADAAGTESVLINSDGSSYFNGGNVGIGTTSPSSLLHLADAGNITVGTTTGTKIGTATTQKLGFFNKTPVVQPTAVANATDAASVITQLNALLARMRDLGLIAT